MNSLLNHFLNHINDLDEAHNFLKANKDVQVYSYDKLTCRKILFSLLIYKFPDNHDCNENLKLLSREIIIRLLRSQEINDIINNYLNEFELWKKEEHRRLIYELSVNYFNLNEIRLGIVTNSQNIDVDKEWIYQIESLQNKLLLYISNMNGVSFHEKNIKELQNKKFEQLYTIFDELYWRKFEDDLINNNYEMLLQNFIDLKKKLLEIHNDSDTDDFLDSDLLIKGIQGGLFTKTTLINIIEFICHKLLIYGIPAFDRTVINQKKTLLDEIDLNDLSPSIISKTFKILSTLLSHLHTTIKTYRSTYFQN
jgi:hypothetical protein